MVKELHVANPLGQNLDAFGAKFTFPEIAKRSFPNGMGVADEAFPNVFPFLGDFVEEQDLDLSARCFLHADEAGGQDFRVVAHKDVARTQIIRDIPENTMFELVMFAVYDHELGLVPLLEGRLGDAVFRQSEIKKGDIHVQNPRLSPYLARHSSLYSKKRSFLIASRAPSTMRMRKRMLWMELSVFPNSSFAL